MEKCLQFNCEISKVKVVLKGGLGNQLFQLAFAYALCEKYGIHALELYTGNLARYKTKRQFELSPWVNGQTFVSRKSGLNKFLTQFIDRFFCGVLFARRTVWITGYFQDYVSISRYVGLSDYKSAIIKLRNGIKIDSTLQTSFNGLTVLHLRGTDFAPIDEIISHAEELIHLNRLNSLPLFLVSDDKLLVKKITPRLKIIGADYLFGYSSFQMLQVFITADVLITNGSTLSWWSAILGQKEIYTNRKNLLVIYKWLKGQ
jgi:hypothetical protein